MGSVSGSLRTSSALNPAFSVMCSIISGVRVLKNFSNASIFNFHPLSTDKILPQAGGGDKRELAGRSRTASSPAREAEQDSA